MSMVTIESFTRQVILNGQSQMKVSAKATQYERAGKFSVEIKAGSKVWVYGTQRADGQFAFVPDLSLLEGFTTEAKILAELTVRFYENGVETGSATETVEMRAVPSMLEPEASEGWVSIQPYHGENKYPEELYVKNSMIAVSIDPAKVTFKYGAKARSFRAVCSPSAVLDDFTEAKQLLLILPRDGEVTITCAVRDTRDYEISERITVTAYTYMQPALSGVAVYRANDQHVATEDGTRICVKADASIAPLDGSNTAVEFVAELAPTGSMDPPVVIDDLSSGKSALFPVAVAQAKSYKVVIRLKDSCGNSATYTTIIPTMSAAFNIKRGGKGAAFNKMAEVDGALDLDTWDLVTEGNIEAGDAIFSGDIAAEIATFKEVNASNLMTPLDAYPVGSIYMSVKSESPAQLFGGTWAQLKDMFLLAAGDTYAAGSTGGAAEHTLTVDEMPAHNHGFKMTAKELASGSTFSRFNDSGTASDNIITETGGGKPFDTMPPYIAVYVWQRTA